MICKWDFKKGKRSVHVEGNLIKAEGDMIVLILFVCFSVFSFTRIITKLGPGWTNP